MKLQTAHDLMYHRKCYRVHFEKRELGLLYTDYFPERDEPAFVTEEEAWKWAREFATKSPLEYVNIYVVDEHWRPVPGYQERRLRTH